jgi:hypothetical protein
MRIVGTRFAGNDNAVIAWYADQTPELGVYAA